MESKYIQGTRKRKIQFYSLISIGISILIFFESGMYKELVLSNENATTEEIKYYLSSQSFWSVGGTALFLFLFIYLKKHAFNYAKRIESSGQYPPPGARIPFTHKVYTGQYAKNCALSFKITSVTFIILALAVMAMEIYLYFEVYSL